MPRLVLNLNGKDRPSESITLTIKDDAGQPSHWFIVPPVLVTVEPSADLRSALVTPLPDAKLGMGRQTIKVVTRTQQAADYFALQVIEAPRPQVAAPAATPSPAAQPRAAEPLMPVLE